MRRDEGYFLELKEKAESLVKQIELYPKSLTAEEAQKLVHDFHVYQIELQLQNDELIRISSQLEKSLQQFYNLYHNAPISYLVLDENGIVIHANNTFCNHCEKTLDQIIYKPFSDYIILELKSEFNSRYKAFFKNPSSKYYETKLIINNKIKDVHIEAAQIASDKINLNNHQGPLLLVTIQDVTEIKNAQEITKKNEIQLKELNDARDKFFSIIAHDLRSPFNGLLGMLEYFKDELTGIEENNKILIHSVYQSAKGVYNLLDNLLNWASSQTGRLKLNPSIIEFSDLIDEINTIYKDIAVLKGIKIKVDIKDKIRANLDVDLFKTVLMNIISNSIKYSYKGGEILINAFIDSNMLVIIVQDFGIGMTTETSKSLFKPGEIISSRGTENEKGTGIGLLICKEFVNLHKGTIDIHSELGKGTKTIIKIPQW